MRCDYKYIYNEHRLDFTIYGVGWCKHYSMEYNETLPKQYQNQIRACLRHVYGENWEDDIVVYLTFAHYFTFVTMTPELKAIIDKIASLEEDRSKVRKLLNEDSIEHDPIQQEVMKRLEELGTLIINANHEKDEYMYKHNRNSRVM